MFKRIALALGFAAVFATSALAQNTTCSNRPTGDNSNACANTRFVQTAIGAYVPSLTIGSTTITGGVNRGQLYNDNGILGNIASIEYDIRKYAVAPKTATTVCNGSGDDAATLQAAIDAANTNLGGRVVLPAGACRLGSTIGMTNYANIIIEGQGAARNGGSNVTNLIYTPATGAAFTLDGAIGVIFQNIGFQYSNAAYNGDFFDLRQVSGTSNTNLITIRDSFIRGTSGTANSLIRLGGSGTLSTRIERTFLQGAAQTIRGGTNSNNVFIANCFFNTNTGTTNHVGTQGEGWTLINNTFEPTATTVTNNVVANGTTNGLKILGNTFNDGATGTLITLTGGVVTGLSINGNILQGGDFSINVGSAVGVEVEGNYLNSNSTSNLIVSSATLVVAQGNWGPGTLVSAFPATGPFLIDRNNGSSLLKTVGFSLGVAGSRVGQLEFNNATSGTIMLQPVTGALGTRTISLPAADGTVAVSATAPITLSAAGAIGCATCGTGTVTSVATSGGVSGGTITTTGTIALAQTPPGGRLTLTSNTPVLSANATAQTTLYYTPYVTDLIPIYDGSATWTTRTFTELSVNLASSANWASGSVYDWFVAVDSGTTRLCSGPAWTSSTGRGTGAGTTQLTMTNGLMLNTVSMTCRYGAASTFSAGALTATYVGTTYMTANGQTGMNFNPTAAAGGTANILGVYNGYNRVKFVAISRDSTASWTLAVTPWRAANNNTNNSISWVDGLQRDGVTATYRVGASTATTNGVMIGINIDSTSTPIAHSFISAVGGSNANNAAANAEMVFLPQLGYHTINAVEGLIAAATNTFYGSGWGGATSQVQSLQVHVFM